MWKTWLGGSLAIALVLGYASEAIALAQPNVYSQVTPSEKAIAMLDTLEAHPWQLVSYRNLVGETMMAVPEQPAVFQFQDGRIAGTTGCNRFFNPYTHDGNSLSFSTGGVTLMACFPEALAQQENAILTQLPQVTSYAITSGALTLLDEAGNTLMTFQAQPNLSLTQTQWHLTFYNNGRGGLVSPLASTIITATFDENQGLGGSAGCNTYRATYELLESSAIAIGPAASSRRYCGEPAGLMEQESAYLNLLASVASYTINGNELELKDGDGNLLARFVAQ